MPSQPRTVLLLGLVAAAEAGQGDLPAPPFGVDSNGGWFGREKHIAPAAGKQPHIAMILFDDYGWADAGWHRIDDKDPSRDVLTPNMNQLVAEGIEMDRHYVYKCAHSTTTRPRRCPSFSSTPDFGTDIARPRVRPSSLGATHTT